MFQVNDGQEESMDEGRGAAMRSEGGQGHVLRSVVWSVKSECGFLSKRTGNY